MSENSLLTGDKGIGTSESHVAQKKRQILAPGDIFASQNNVVTINVHGFS